MKKLLISLAMVAGFVSFGFSQEEEIAQMLTALDSSITAIFTSITSNVSKSIDENVQFYGSSGNVYVPNVSTYPGIRVGIGIGFNLPGYYIRALTEENFDFTSGLAGLDPNASYFDQIGSAFGAFFALLPLPYDMVYFKMALPESFIKTPITRYMDLGIRIGFLPDVIGILLDNFADTGNDMLSYDLGINSFHIGAEARTLLLGKPKSLFNFQLSASYDMDFGGFGGSISTSLPLSGSTNTGGFDTTFNGNFGLKFVWRGASIGTKAVASINLRILYLYAGFGLNMNVGSVKSEMNLDGTLAFADLVEFPVFEKTIKYVSWYDLFDARLMGGVSFFGFFNTAVEYSLTHKTLAVTIMPICLAF